VEGVDSAAPSVGGEADNDLGLDDLAWRRTFAWGVSFFTVPRQFNQDQGV
jgi:hypothetical protein